MSRLPRPSGRDVVKALARAGFVVVGRKGSHVRMRGFRLGAVRVVVVPDHAELAPGTLASILRQARLTRDEFLELAG